MPFTETATVRVRGQGFRVVKRQIDDLGQAANRATRGIFLLQRALFVVGGAGVLRGLQRYADALTNIENRLRLTTTSTENLEAVQAELFDTARRSRSDLQATADVYNRIALSARNLGVGQRQILDVTETLQKAAIISGASAREANAALIQLGQGIASDRLSGDELRSVLEQLPAVADILVDFLNDTGKFGEVTRGTLRQLGKEGKLTSELVFRAIQSAQGSINEVFAETQPTIEQAFQVAETNLLDYIDSVDDAFNISEKIANTILALSQNIEVFTGALTALGVAFATFLAGRIIQRVQTFGAALTTVGAALTRLRGAQLASATAENVATGATIRNTQARIANLSLRRATAGQALLSARAEFQEAQAAFVNGRARDANTGRFIASAAARDRLTAASIRLNNAERVSVGLATRLGAARSTLAAAETAQTASSARLAGVQAAQATRLSKLAQTFPLISGAAIQATRAVKLFTLAIAANPIGAIITALVAAIAFIFTFGNAIKVQGSQIVTLKDQAVAVFQLIGEAIVKVLQVFGFLSPVVKTVGGAFKSFASVALQAVGDVFETFVDIFTFIPRLVIGTINGIVQAWKALPEGLSGVADALVALFRRAFARLLDAAANTANKVGAFFANIFGVEFEGFEGGALDKVNADLAAQAAAGAGDAGVGAAEAFEKGFSDVFQGGSAEGIREAVRVRAFANVQDAGKTGGSITDLELDPDNDGTGGGTGSGNKKDFASELAALNQKIELEKQFGIQKKISNEILRVEQAIKRELSATEQEQVATAVRQIEVATEYGRILEEIKGPQEQLRVTQAALNQLYDEGLITLSQYNEQLREVFANQQRANGSIGGGFQASIADSLTSATEFGEAIGNEVVGAVDGLANAFVEFAKTGKLNIKQVFATLFANLAQLAAKRALLQLLGAAFGVPGGGVGAGVDGGGIGAVIGGFLGASGGSILPSGNGTTDSRFLPLNVRPDERVDILTPQQQRMQDSMMKNGSGETTVVQAPAPNVVVQITPDDIANALSGEAGDRLIVQGLERNSTAARATLGNQ